MIRLGSPARTAVRSLCAGVMLVGLVACGSSQQGGEVPPATPSPSPSEGGFTVPPDGQRTGAVATAPAGDMTFTLKAQSGDDGGVDFQAYDEAMDYALGAINEYWIETMAVDFGSEWIPPSDFIAYYPPEDDGPLCGGQEVGPDNAVYCAQGADDFIAWDEPGLMLPYYQDLGDMANAVILAHEFGHGAQARLGEEFDLTIESELQADCFAGAWAAWADEQGMLGEDAADQSIEAILSVADPEGVLWTDPDAHGTGEERLQAFSDGVDGGAVGCYENYAPGFSG